MALTARQTETACDRAMVWNSLSGGVVVVSDTSDSVTCPSERANGGIGLVAIAGSTVSWFMSLGGNTEQTTWLQTASAARPGKETTVAQATWNPEANTGKYLAGLVGRNSLTAFNSWSGDSEAPVDERLRKVTATGSTTILSGPNAVFARATDGSTLVVPNADGTVALVSSTGAMLQELEPAGAVRSVAINAGRVAVQEAGRVVEVYSVASGALVDTLTLKAGAAAGIDMYRGVVVYHTRRDVRAVAVATGLDRKLVTAPGEIVEAEIEGPGVVYAYGVVVRGQAAGRVERVPLATVLSAMG